MFTLSPLALRCLYYFSVSKAVYSFTQYGFLNHQYAKVLMESQYKILEITSPKQ